jgi:hypothetical protein
VHLGSTQDHVPHSSKNLAPTLLRVHGQHRGIARIDGQEVAQGREGRPQILAQPEDSALNFCDDRSFGVALFDAKIPPQHVDQGV